MSCRQELASPKPHSGDVYSVIRELTPDAEETRSPTSVQTTLSTLDPNLNGLQKDHETNGQHNAMYEVSGRHFIARNGSLQQDSNTSRNIQSNTNLTLPSCRELIQPTASRGINRYSTTEGGDLASRGCFSCPVNSFPGRTSRFEVYFRALINCTIGFDRLFR